MPSGEGFLRIRQHGQTICCHVVGQATMRQSPSLRNRIERCLATGPITLHVDLDQCTYMDSTFIGTLLMFKRRLADHHVGDFALVAPSPDCLRLLRQMGMSAVFCMLPQQSPLEGADEVFECEPEGDSFKRTIVEAHQELAGMPGPAGAIFCNVAAHLTQDWEAQQRKLAATQCAAPG